MMIVLRCAIIIIHDEALILDPDLAVLAIRAYPIASQDSLAESRRLKLNRPPNKSVKRRRDADARCSFNQHVPHVVAAGISHD